MAGSAWPGGTSAPTGTAAGDLTGSYPSPGVAKVNGTSVPATPTTGTVLTATSSTTAAWQAAAGGAPSGAATGDLSGTYPAPTVAKVNGVTVSGTPTAGQVPIASSGTAAAWGAVAPITRTVGTGLATTGTVNLDLATLNGTSQWIVASGNLTFTTSNLTAGRDFNMRIDAGGSSRTIAWPAWIPLGAALPTTLASGKTLVLSIESWGTTDANVTAAVAVQP